MKSIELLAFGLGTGAMLHCLFMAGHLMQLPSKKSNSILSLLLVALAVRIAKSLIAWYWPEYITILSVIGLTVMATIGPLLLLYICSASNSAFNIKVKTGLHFIPALAVGSAVILVFSNEALFYGYATINLQLLIYLTWAVWTLRSDQEIRTDDVTFKWLIYLVAGLFVISISFFAQLFINVNWVYLCVTLIAASVLYSLSWLSKKYSKVFLVPSHKTEISLYHYQLAKKVEALFQQDEIYKDPLLTLSRLAAQLKSPHYTVSQAINAYFNKTFPELLIHHRIKKAETLLVSPQNYYLTIEAVAYESGFSSLSAFYTGFKKLNKLTPAQFRDRVKASTTDLKRIS